MQLRFRVSTWGREQIAMRWTLSVYSIHLQWFVNVLKNLVKHKTPTNFKVNLTCLKFNLIFWHKQVTVRGCHELGPKHKLNWIVTVKVGIYGWSCSFSYYWKREGEGLGGVGGRGVITKGGIWWRLSASNL